MKPRLRFTDRSRILGATFLLAAATTLSAGAGSDAPGSGAEFGAGEPIFEHRFEFGTICGWSSSVGLAPPSSAVDPLLVSGSVLNVISGLPITGATIEARRRSDDGLLDSDTTGDDGTFGLSLVTGGVPLDAYFALSAASYPATFIYPADPLVDDIENLGARAIATGELSLVYALSLVVQTPGLGTNAVLVLDCANEPVSAATVSFDPAAGATLYFSGDLPSPGASSTSDNGIGLGLNAPVGETTASAAKAGFVFLSHSFESHPDGVSFTFIHP